MARLSFVIHRQMFPAFFQDICRLLGLPLSGEYPFLIAVDAHDALHGLEIREIPNLLSFDAVIGVKYPVIQIQIFLLILHTPLDTGQLMLPGQVITAVFRENKRTGHPFF